MLMKDGRTLAGTSSFPVTKGPLPAAVGSKAPLVPTPVGTTTRQLEETARGNLPIRCNALHLPRRRAAQWEADRRVLRNAAPRAALGIREVRARQGELHPRGGIP